MEQTSNSKPTKPQPTKPQPIADLRPTLVYFCLASVTIVLGMLLRFILIGLPFVIVKYGGSALWAIMVYCLIAALIPYRTPWLAASIGVAFSTLLELFRLHHSPSLDAFRLTLAGALLLGRIFDPWHIAAYTSAILLAAIADNALIRPHLNRRKILKV